MSHFNTDHLGKSPLGTCVKVTEMNKSALKNGWIANTLGSLSERASCIKGVAAVEFALIAPILIAIWLGSNEFGQALMIDRRVTLTTSAVADLVAQSDVLTEADVDDYFGVADTLMAPALMSIYKPNNFRLTVINVRKDGNGNLTVVWARKKNGSNAVIDGQYPEGPIEASEIDPDFDADIVLPNSFQIIAKGEYDYSPVVGQYIAGTMTLKDMFFAAPRKGQVQLVP